MKYLLVIIAFYLLTGCDGKKIDVATNTSQYYHSIYCNASKMDSLKKKIERGDTVAYKELREVYTLSNNHEELLTFAIRMAEDYHYNDAYFDAYLSLIAGKSKKKQEFSIDLANYFLIRAYELGNKAAKENILYRFGDTALKNLPSSKEQWRSISK